MCFVYWYIYPNMRVRTLIVLMVILVARHPAAAQEGFEELRAAFEAVNEAVSTKFDAMGEMVGALTDTVKDLARQTMLQQLFVEERIRSDGDSGVKVVRGGTKGPANYYANNHIGGAFNSIHDHSNYDTTIGMGEVVVVLNGVEFRTRHNDYKLVMPSRSSKDYDAVDPLPFPGVPKAVSDEDSIDDQIAEMREWFKAFKEQNHTMRDYREFFKPVLCYMEGAWTLDTTTVTEPFQSDRHKIDASSWFELQELVRYSSYTGSKSRLENYAYLPTTIMAVNDTTGKITYAQWNYRILCNPIQQDIPTSYLKQAEDLSFRYPRGRELSDVTNSRSARFRFYEQDKPQFTKFSLIDKIFYDIPGKDNTPDQLSQEGFGEEMYSMASSANEDLNTGYYHRWFRFSKAGAMGLTSVARGFNDENLWVAQTTQPKVAPVTLESCSWEKVPGKKGKQKVCVDHTTRFSYAIPLEIVYLTPLLSWNPYNITVHEEMKIATADGRVGSENKPYDGVDSGHYYLTPPEFFKGPTDFKDPADTVKSVVWVLDSTGTPQRTKASGTRIMLPSIEDVGQVRLRYPIAPVHGEGSSVWKELNALRDMVLEEEAKPEGPPTTVLFEMSVTLQDPPGEHTHEFILSWDNFKAMIDNQEEFEVTTTEAQGHSHLLTIIYNTGKKRFEYTQCSGYNWCRDGHPRKLNILTESEYTESALAG